MHRFFFDFDDAVDEHGVLLPSMNEACNEAIRTMPEYLSGLLARDRIPAEISCSIREADAPAAYRIVMSMRVEDEKGALISVPSRSMLEPLQISDQHSKCRSLYRSCANDD